MIAPKIVAMAEEMKDKCVFAKVDVDEAPEISEEYEIQVTGEAVLRGRCRSELRRLTGVKNEMSQTMLIQFKAALKRIELQKCS